MILTLIKRLVRQDVVKNNKWLPIAVRHLNTKLKEQYESSKAVNKAEKIIGYPTSFLSLRWLLNDEIANVALHLRKLIGTNHPLLNTARELILNKHSPSWGLIVLLVSKAGGTTKKFSQMDCDITAGILHNQRVLAEITEMVRTSNIVHKSILNISDRNSPDFADLYFGNKLSLLTGDYLLSSSFRELAGLKCHDVNELISTCLKDLVEADFIDPRTKQNEPVPAKPLGIQKEEVIIPNQFDEDILRIEEVLGRAKAEWTLRHLLGGASLLAKCCQGTLILAGHPESFQRSGYLFGRNMALAWQANNDLSIYSDKDSGSFSLINAPLLYHLEHDPLYYDQLMSYVERDDIDYKEIKDVVLKGPGIEKTVLLKKELSENALKVLDDFQDSDAKTALINLIKTL